MTTIDRLDMKKYLEELLQQNSGGIKMSALIANLMTNMHEDGFDIKSFSDDMLDEVIEAHLYIHVLEYEWDMNGAMYGNGNHQDPCIIRSKQFVYTKF